jgi:hypothetical protein
MQRLAGLFVAFLVSGTVWGLTTAHAQSAAASSQQPAATNTPPPVVAQQADQLLKEASDYLASASQFTFHAEIAFDHVLPSGQKLQFSAGEDVALLRPGRLYVEWSGDLGNRQFWYDGSSVTLYDPDSPFYASESAPADIDGMLDKVLSELDFSPPLSDFLYARPYDRVRAKIQFGFDLGLNDVDGRSCHTLAFVEKDIDWQIWIQAGPQPVPCNLLITYKNVPSQPQFRADFTDWDFDPRIATPVFSPDLPAGVQKIPFATVSAAK